MCKWVTSFVSFSFLRWTWKCRTDLRGLTPTRWVWFSGVSLPAARSGLWPLPVTSDLCRLWTCRLFLRSLWLHLKPKRKRNCPSSGQWSRTATKWELSLAPRWWGLTWFYACVSVWKVRSCAVRRTSGSTCSSQVRATWSCSHSDQLLPLPCLTVTSLN